MIILSLEDNMTEADDSRFYENKPGPRPKADKKHRISITMSPAAHQALRRYMEGRGYNNVSATIEALLVEALSDFLPYA